MIRGKLRAEGDRFSFFCPGCRETHTVGVGWNFDGDYERPTFSPSVLVRSGCYAEQHRPGDECWCVYNADRPDQEPAFRCRRCHSFVRDGKIQFLSDCSHELVGQTMDLPDFEEKHS